MWLLGGADAARIALISAMQGWRRVRASRRGACANVCQAASVRLASGPGPNPTITISATISAGEIGADSTS